jgi:hypothetical protein
MEPTALVVGAQCQDFYPLDHKIKFMVKIKLCLILHHKTGSKCPVQNQSRSGISSNIPSWEDAGFALPAWD